MVDAHTAQVSALRDRASRNLWHRVDRAGSELHHVLARLRGLSPLATLERGYAIVQRRVDWAVLRDPAEAAIGDDLRVRLAQGELAARVIES